MQQSDSHPTVRVIPRPARRRRKSSRLPLWALLVVLGVFAGAFAVSANVGLLLPAFERSDAPRQSAIPQVSQTRSVVLPPAVPTLIPATTVQEQPSPAAEVRVTLEPATATAPASVTVPPSALLFGLRHEYQGWNNCAPSSVGMVLSYYDRTEAQAEIAPILKPDPNDKNVSPYEIAAYAEAIGFQAHVGVGGDLNLVMQLLAAGFPVIAEIWFEPKPDDGMGHYRVLFGYDNQSQILKAHDSYSGPNLTMTYSEFDGIWHVFNRTYIVIYPQDDQQVMDAILNEGTKDTRMWERALHIAQQELSLDQNNAFAWFNLGTSALNLGDARQAAQAFDWARQLGLPWRMFWYQFGPFEAYLAQGRYQDVIALAEAGMEDAAIEEWYFWRGRAREMTGDLSGARKDYETALELNANFLAARDALAKSQNT